MKANRISYQIAYIGLCICVILLFTRLTPDMVAKKEQPTQVPYETTTKRALYDVGMMSPNHLLGLMPKKVNEFVEQHLDEELILNELTSYEECLALLDYLKMLQRVLYQMFVCLVTLICIHTTRRRVLNYIYNKDGPRRNIPLITTF